ncbi:glycosyltransferase family 4 protein [bacterium]|nr:glycosyltransferase family 4 protein [bacterium]
MMKIFSEHTKKTIVYPINIRFPMERANSIQIIHTCRALAQCGVKVYLLVRRSCSLSDKQILAFYGITPHNNLIIKRLWVINYDGHPFIWNKSYYVCVLIYITYLLFIKKVDCFFLRDLALARVLIPFKNLFNFKLFYESHIVSYLMAQRQHLLFPATEPANSKKVSRIKQRESYIFNHSDIVITITRRLKEKIKEIFIIPDEKIQVIADGVDTESFKPDKNVKREGIIYIGQVYPWKGVDTLIEAMKYINTTLKVIGGIPFEDDLERLKNKARQIGIADKISFLGFIKPKDVASHLKTAKISVIPLPDNVMARDYTSPLKLFESMSSGTAVVASDLPSIREIISDGVNGLLYPPADPIALAEAVNKLDSDDALLNKITANALKDATQYSWKNRADRIIKLINLVCE